MGLVGHSSTDLQVILRTASLGLHDVLTYIHPKQKRNVMKVFMWIMIISIIGTALVKLAEHMFGVVNVFMFAVAVTSIVGVIVVPVMQLKQKYNRQ